MKKILLLTILITLFSFKNENEHIISFQDSYPKTLGKILDAHGGIQAWRKMSTLTYQIQKPEGDEVQTIDLRSRKDKIVMPNVELGFDGAKAWLLEKDGTYDGNPEFYHNLVFYFYAMPFVLADPGISYEEAKVLDIGEKSYPGIKITYSDGIGNSPKDEYFLHYDPINYRMCWLGYTATFGADQSSDRINWINYNDWTAIEGIILPKSITWQKFENGKMTPQKKVSFKDITLSKDSKSDGFYAKPENAKWAGANKD